MTKFTGYGDHNNILNILEDLVNDTYSRSTNPVYDDITRARAESAREAYKFCQYLLMNFDKFNG